MRKKQMKKSASSVIENYKNKVKELGKDPNPGHKAIVVYGGYMGKSYHTYAALDEIKLYECYPEVTTPYIKRKGWVDHVINNAKKNLPLLVIDSYMFPYSTCKREFVEYNELVKSIPESKFGFYLSQPYKLENETIPEGFFEIKSNLVFIVGYSIPDDLIDVMPSYNFNFDGSQLLSYLRENIDTIYPKLDILTHEMRIEMVDLLSKAYEDGVYDSCGHFDFQWINDAFHDRYFFETKRKSGESSDMFFKDYAERLSLIKDGSRK
jgi:hypothetical protein